MKTLLTCQRKYYHAKVANTPKDPDYEESDSLSLGKAFHYVLENSLHEYYNEALVMKAMNEFQVRQDEKELLMAMLDNYIKVHKLSGLKVMKCEIKIEAANFVGYIDFIAQGDNGWWMGDNKTAARHDPNILPRLHRDAQLNLYAKFADRIGDLLKLEGKFLGFRYRQSIKSKAKTPKGLKDGTPTYDIVIPVGLLEPDETWNNFLDAYDLAKEIHGGVVAKPNYNACFDYFRPCEFFSQCHGVCHSEGHNGIKVLTKESYEDADLLNGE
jgi:hypothetical protein